MKTYILPILPLLLLLVVSCQEDEPEIYVPVKSVSVSKSAIWLEEGGCTKLEALVLPDSASNKRVQWKSSDESVAKVDNKGNVTATGGGEVKITVTTQDNGWTATSTCYVKAKDKGGTHFKRTVLVYIAADNSLSNFAAEDWAEMKAGMEELQDEEVRLLAYIDTGRDPRLLALGRKDGKVCMSVEKLYDSRNSVGVAETQEVLDWVFSSYQADSYGLIYWSHGEGWIPYPAPSSRWVGQDIGSGDRRMNISELVEILQQAPHFDFIMFDACFMQSVEVAYELRDYCDYYIGFPAENPGPGAAYDRMFPYMFQEGAAVKMAEATFNAYNELYTGTMGSDDNWTMGTAIGVFKSSELQGLADATDRALSGVTEADADFLRGSLFNYDRRGLSSHIGYYDFVELMEAFLQEQAALDEWKRAYDAASVYWAKTPKIYSMSCGLFSMERANGVSHYIPSPSKPAVAKAYRSLKWYEAAGLSRLGW